MRRQLVWLVTGPVVLFGVEAAHAVANALVDSPEGGLLELGASTRGSLPVVTAALAASLAVALTSRAAGWWSSSRSGALVAAPFALLPPLGFAALELGEAVLSPGGPDWGSLTAPAAGVGLALQLPFAFAGYLLARLLLRLSDEIAARARRLAPPVAAYARRAPVPPADESPRRTAPVRGVRGRAPPVALARPG